MMTSISRSPALSIDFVKNLFESRYSPGTFNWSRYADKKLTRGTYTSSQKGGSTKPILTKKDLDPGVDLIFYWTMAMSKFPPYSLTTT